MPGEEEEKSQLPCGSGGAADSNVDAPRKSFAQIVLEAGDRPKVPIQVKPPGFTDQGEPAVYFSAEEIQASCEFFKFAVVAKCSYGRPSIPEIRSFLTQKFQFKSACVISRLNVRHLLIRLSCEEDVLQLMIQKHIYIRGFLLRFFRWSRNFSYDSDPSTVPAWIGFPELPVHFFHESMLRSIAGNIGYVLRIHDSTLALTDTSEAVVCVDLDLGTPRRNRIWIGSEEGGFWQKVSYHRVPQYCSFCHKIGHSEGQCKTKQRKLKDKATVDKVDNIHAIRQEYRPRVVNVHAVTEDVHTRYNVLTTAEEVVVGDSMAAQVQSEHNADSVIIQTVGIESSGSLSVSGEVTGNGLVSEESGISVKVVDSSAILPPIQHQGVQIEVPTQLPPGNITQDMQGINEGAIGGNGKLELLVARSLQENILSSVQETVSHSFLQKPINTNVSDFPGVLFSDTRLTRAKAKLLASHSLASSSHE